MHDFPRTPRMIVVLITVYFCASRTTTSFRPITLDCAQQYQIIGELYCVNYHVEPTEIFVLLRRKLTRITRLNLVQHHREYRQYSFTTRLACPTLRRGETYTSCNLIDM
ncbi:hypothetical protein MRX96_042130 [Rhipicephalus microplus]